MKKTETIAEFLARGGSIQVIPANQSKVKNAETVVKSTTGGGPVVMLSMGEADLYYGEAKAKKAKKPAEKLDLSALPEALRKKYVDEVLNAKNEEDDED